jgi:hypothetical protein
MTIIELLAIGGNVKNAVDIWNDGIQLYNKIQEKRLGRFFEMLGQTLHDPELDSATAQKINNLQLDEKMAEKIFQQARRSMLAESTLVIGTIALVTSYLIADAEHSYKYIKYLRILQVMTDEEIIFIEKVVTTYERLKTKELKLPTGKQFTDEQLLALTNESIVIQYSGQNNENFSEITNSLRIIGAIGARPPARNGLPILGGGSQITNDTIAIVKFYRKAQRFENSLKHE